MCRYIRELKVRVVPLPRGSILFNFCSCKSIDLDGTVLQLDCATGIAQACEFEVTHA